MPLKKPSCKWATSCFNEILDWEDENSFFQIAVFFFPGRASLISLSREMASDWLYAYLCLIWVMHTLYYTDS